MELTFNKVGNKYISEFEVTSDFNIHIERPEGGITDIYQRTSPEGEYAVVDGFDTNGKSVIDVDFTALVYPKWIKVISGAETTRVIVLPEGVAKPVVAFRTEYDANIYEDRKACYDAIAALLPKDDWETHTKLPATVTIQSTYEGDPPFIVDNATWSNPTINLWREKDGWNDYQCSIIPSEDYAIRYED